MTDNDEIEIDLLKIMKALMKKVWLVVLVAAIIGGAVFAYGNAKYVPSYTAETTLYASYVSSQEVAFGESAGSISKNSLSEARSLVTTCVAVLNTRMTQEAVIAQAGLDMTAAQLSGMVTAQAVNNTELFKVTVTASDPQEAALLANTIGKVLPEHVAMVNGNSTVGVIDEALVPTGPSNSRGAMQNALVAAVMGAFVVCGVIAVQIIVEDVKAAKKK